MFLIFILGSIGNWSRLIRAMLGHRKGSGIPIVFGVIGAISIFAAPANYDLARWHSFWWVPLFIDVGCVPWLVYFVWFLVKKRGQTR